MRFTAEIQGVHETIDAGLETLVTSLANLHDAAGLDRSARQIPNGDRIAFNANDDAGRAAIRARKIADTPKQEPLVECAIDLQPATIDSDDACAGRPPGEVDPASVVPEFRPAFRRCARAYSLIEPALRA